MTKTKARKPVRRRSALEQRSTAAAKHGTGDWLTMTLAADRTRVAKVPLPLWNWLIITALVAGWSWTLRHHGDWRWPAAVTVLFVVVTFTRGATVAPRRRKTVADLYQQLTTIAGYPKGTITKPANPAARIKVTRWWKKHPARLQLAVSADAPAATPARRWELERIIDAIPHRFAADGRWLFTWDAPTTVACEPVASDDPRIVQQQRRQEITADLNALFGADKPKLAQQHGHDCRIDSWGDANDLPVIPETVTYAFGGQDTTDPQFRDRIEREFDRRRKMGGYQWLYDWCTSGQLQITLHEQASTPAQRKLVSRRIADQMTGVAARGKDPVTCQVTKWADDLAWEYPEAVADPVVPVALAVNLGTRDVTGDKGTKITDSFDEFIAVWFPSLVWVHEWERTAASELHAAAVPQSHPTAVRKHQFAALRAAVDQKFSGRNQSADVAILDWYTDPHGVEQPATVELTFGAIDVQNPLVRDDFQKYLDGRYPHDWNYTWNPEVGTVKAIAVAKLPDIVPFPRRGTPDYDKFVALAREGKFWIGPRRGGGDCVWDAGREPHGLVSGSSNRGKSVVMRSILLGIFLNPGALSLMMCDPKRTDFGWTREFPNTIMFGAQVPEMCKAVDMFNTEMDRRQTLLEKRGVENMRELRRLYAERPDLAEQDGPAPHRWIMMFDEIMNFLGGKAASNEVQDMKQVAVGQMDSVAQVGRAMEMNMLGATQKPDGTVMSMQLRNQMLFRVAMGQMEGTTSKQALGTTHAAGLGDAPPGRGYAGPLSDSYDQVHTFWISQDDALALIRQNLAEQGYRQVHVPNAAGGMDPRWVHVDAKVEA